MKIVTHFRWYTLILRKPLTNWRTDKDREDDQESIKNLFTQFEYFMKLKWLFNELNTVQVVQNRRLQPSVLDYLHDN